MGAPLLRPAGVLEDEKGMHLLTLSVLLLQLIGPEYISWDSQALREELEDRFGNIGIVTWERIQAGRLMHTHSAFWDEWEVFEKVTAAIVGEPPIFSHTQPPEAEEIAMSLVTAARIDKRPYRGEVLSYMAAACLNDGTWYLEAPLDVIQPALTEHDLRFNIRRDVGSVAARLRTATKYIQEPETFADVQVNNVLSVRKALTEYNRQVESQAKMIPDMLRRSK